jgi:hypothetical protein
MSTISELYRSGPVVVMAEKKLCYHCNWIVSLAKRREKKKRKRF